MSLADLTWTCHVCGDERPDRAISVAQHVTPIMGGRTHMTRNVRYCNDRESCAAAAYDPERWKIGGGDA